MNLRFHRLVTWTIGIPRRILNYQIYKTTRFEKLIFIASYFLGFGLASDETSNPIEIIYTGWAMGTFLGWFFFGFWRWFLRNFTARGY